ncbi:MAG TPA: hypothetical protein VHJ76_02750 [Actinomycetota bacterium]|nr:hypothetical protein [Actinomycetota bacterium]
MRRLQLSWTGAVVPHAPLLLPEVAGKKNASATAPVAEAVASLDLGDPDVTLIASPHGSTTGVYARVEGNLDAFGPRGVDVSAPTDAELAAALAREWGRPLLDEPADHGIVVPLRLLAATSPVVAVALGPDDADAFVQALLGVTRDRAIAFVASANTSAGLDERAPLPSLDGARDADEDVLDALRERPADLGRRLDALAAAGSCAVATLGAFGLLFPDRPCEVLAYAHPFGVGYPVAVAR